MSDQRFQVFRDELSFWQWAVQAPGQRVGRAVIADKAEAAATKLPQLYRIDLRGRKPYVSWSKGGDRWVEIEMIAYPQLISSADEHGPITPPEPSPLERELDEAIGGPIDEATKIACVNTANWLVDELEKEADRNNISDDQFTSGCCSGRKAMVYVARRLIGRAT